MGHHANYATLAVGRADQLTSAASLRAMVAHHTRGGLDATCTYSDLCGPTIWPNPPQLARPLQQPTIDDAIEAAHDALRAGGSHGVGVALVAGTATGGRVETVTVDVPADALTRDDATVQTLVQQAGTAAAGPDETVTVHPGSIQLAATGNVVTGGRTPGKTTMTYRARTVPVQPPVGPWVEPLDVTRDSQAAARAAIIDWFTSHPHVVATGTVTAQQVRLDPDRGTAGPLVTLTSAPKKVTATAQVRISPAAGPGRLVLVGDCHH